MNQRTIIVQVFCFVAMTGCLSVPRAMGQVTTPYVPHDPMVWNKPAKPPVMREMLKGHAYTDAFANAVAPIEPALAPDSPVRKQRSAYLVVALLQPGSKAQQNGLRQGDKLITLNGKALWHSLAPLPWNPRGNQLLEVELPDGQRRILTLKGNDGLEGATLQHIWEILFWCLNHPQRDPRWDREMFVGLMAQASNPDLAETAWFHAIRKGYKPDVVSAWSGAHIAAQQSRHRVAFDFATFVPENALHARTPMPFEIEPALRARWALAGMRLDQFNALLLKDEKLEGRKLVMDEAEELIRIHKARPPAKRMLPPPSVRAEKMKRVDILGQVTNQNKSTNDAMVKIAQRGQGMKVAAETDHFQGLLCGLDRPLTRAEFIVRFSFRPTDARPGRFAKELSIGLVKNGTRGQRPVTLNLNLVSNMLATGIGMGDRFNAPSYRFFDHATAMDGKTLHTVRVIRVDDQVELFLNNVRLAYLPVDDAIDHTGFMIWTTGMTANVQKIEIYELVEK